MPACRTGRDKGRRAGPFLVFLFLIHFTSLGNTDSLRKELAKHRDDTTRLHLLVKISEGSGTRDLKPVCEEAIELADKLLSGNPSPAISYRIKVHKATAISGLAYSHMERGDIDKAIELVNNELTLYKEINYPAGVASTLNNLGVIYQEVGNLSLAIEHYSKSLKIREEIGDRKGIAESLHNIGSAYTELGKIRLALERFSLSLKIREELGDKKGIAESLNEMGLVYKDQNDLKAALDYFERALRLREGSGDKRVIAVSLNNIGLIYKKQGNIAKALENYERSLALREEMGDKRGISTSLNNLGNLYAEQGDPAKAKDCLYRSLALRKEARNKDGIATNYINISSLWIKQNELGLARAYADSSLDLAKEIGSLEGLRSAELMLSRVAVEKGDYKGGYQHYRQYIIYRDSLLSEENSKKAAQTRIQYEFDKQEALRDAEQQKKDTLVAEEKRRQDILTASIAIGFLLVLALALLIYRNNLQRKKANKIITLQKEEVEKQKHIIEEKNKDITDSITYAKRIQQAKLPDKIKMQRALPRHFLLYKPKDIVSGDFYYFHKYSRGVLIAAADCTGHGVPGAFMSIIGSEKLDEALMASNDPSEILQHLNRGIKHSLKQTPGDDSTRDGMDIALCVLNTEEGTLQYAGANRPLWIIRKGQDTVEEIKATKKAIGGHTEDDQHYETHQVQLATGDRFYIFSDGYADSFSAEGKKMTTKKFREALLTTRHLDMEAQGKHLDEFVENWKGGTEQIDDILVIGIEI